MNWTREKLTIAIGQRICVGFTGTTVPPELRELIQKYKVGNILLFSRNVESFEQLKALCTDLRELILSETGLPPFIMIDEECGEVTRIGHLSGDTPSAGALGASGDPENARTVGRIIGKRLRAAGVNLNLAPVVDCLGEKFNTSAGNRCFSKDPAQVARFSRAYIEGIHESGVHTCAKHFPGNGGTSVDSHFALPVVNKSLEDLEQTDLVSFREAVCAGTDAVMSAHIVFPALEPEGLPATVSSRVLSGLLRERLGFSDIIISDGMEMHAVMDLFPVPEGVFRALKAGVDIALVCHEPSLAAAACVRILEGVENGELSAENLAEAYQRIAAKKAALPPLGPAEEFADPRDQETCAEIMRRVVRVVHAPENRPLPAINEKTLFWSRPSRRTSPVVDGGHLSAAPLAASRFGSAFCFDGTGEKPESLPESAVFFLQNGVHPEEGLKEAARLADRGIPVVCVGLDVPSVLENAPKNAWHIVAWQYQTLALDAVFALLNA